MNKKHCGRGAEALWSALSCAKYRCLHCRAAQSIPRKWYSKKQMFCDKIANINHKKQPQKRVVKLFTVSASRRASVCVCVKSLCCVRKATHKHMKKENSSFILFFSKRIHLLWILYFENAPSSNNNCGPCAFCRIGKNDGNFRICIWMCDKRKFPSEASLFTFFPFACLIQLIHIYVVVSQY